MLSYCWQPWNPVISMHSNSGCDILNINKKSLNWDLPGNILEDWFKLREDDGASMYLVA